MTPPVRHLLWMDLETTGLDVDRDAIVEVACIVTTADLNEELWSWESLIRPSECAMGRMMLNGPVCEMHTANGIIPGLLQGEGLSIGRASDHIMAEIEKLNIQWENTGGNSLRVHKLALAGSGVGHFDLRFIQKYMHSEYWAGKTLYSYLNYWTLDVGVLRRALMLWKPEAADNDSRLESEHRAMSDCRMALQEARRIKEILGTLSPPFMPEALT